MKAHIGFWMLVLPVVVLAQESDDLYFRSKDRQKVMTTESYVSNYDNFKRQHFPEAYNQDNNQNPTDSYSARQINPEYVARASSEQASEDEQNYFIEGYTPATTSTTNYYSGSSFNNGWNTGWYTPGWYGPARFNNWYSPYYSFYDPWMSPFWGYGPGWNYGYSNYWSPWGSGWNIMIGYSWGNSWGNNFWGPSWLYWNYPYYYYGSTERTRINYGKRPSANAVVAGDVRNHYPNNVRNQAINNSSGRTRANDEYYVRPSRRPVNDGTNTSSGETFNRTRTYPRDSYTSPTRSTSYPSSRPSYTPSRSSSFPSGGTRSSAPSSGSRSRGRD